MRTGLACLTAAAAALPALTANAEQGGRFYTNLAYTVLDGDGVAFGAATVRVGRTLTDIFGVEGEGSVGVDEDSLGQGATAEVRQQLAGYVTARLPIGERGRIHTRIGYGSVEIRSEAPGLFGTTEEDTFNLDGASLGIGGAYDLTERIGLRGDLTAFEGDEGSLNIVSAGISVRF